MNKLKKIFYKIYAQIIKKYIYINFHLYMKKYVNLLKVQGVKINAPAFISPDVKFDGTDYSLFDIADKVVISKDVLLLTHDFSLYHAFYAAGYKLQEIPNRVKGISIGYNSFIGANSTLLPGTKVGKNSIVGAGSVLRGEYPDNSIIIGNPAKVVDNTIEWINNKVIKSDEYKKFVDRL